MDDPLGTDETLREVPFLTEPVAPGPKRIGPYVVRMRLGHGGMGDVYLVEHEGLRRRYALKVIRPELTLDPETRARFQRECEMLAQVDAHPGIVQVHGAGLQPLPHLVMEYVQGRSLLRAMREGMAEATVFEVLAQTAEALGYAHERGLVHRDVKPGNILVDAEGRARLTDFGLAKVFGQADQQHLTVTGEVIGTPAYMAPEQVDRELGELGPPADVFALGAILYETLLGHPPHVADTAIEVFERLQKGARIAPIRSERRDVSRALEAVCLKALAHHPADRQPDGAAFAAELRAALASESAGTPGRFGLTLGAPALIALVASALTLGAALGVAWERSRAVPPTPGPVAQSPAAPSPVARPATPAPRSSLEVPAARTPLREVARIPPKEVRVGLVATLRWEQLDRYYLGTVIGHTSDGGYEVLYADGLQAQLPAAAAGLWPDVFLPGAEVERSLLTGGEFAPGRIVDRKGQAVLVEAEGERRWLPIWKVRIRADQKVPTPTRPPPAAMWSSRYAEGSTRYVAVELERTAERRRVLYLVDGEQEWRARKDVVALPPAGRSVTLTPYNTQKKVPCVLVRRLNAIAVELRFPADGNRTGWAAWCQLETP